MLTLLFVSSVYKTRRLRSIVRYVTSDMQIDIDMPKTYLFIIGIKILSCNRYNTSYRYTKRYSKMVFKYQVFVYLN